MAGAMKEIMFVGNGDDWVGLYIDGKLKFQGHSIPRFELMAALGIGYKERDDWDVEADGYSLPDNLDEVHFYD